MKTLKGVLAIFCLFLASGELFAKTRTEVASDARSMVIITPGWTAINNSYQFISTITFTSNFSTGVAYSLWPHVQRWKPFVHLACIALVVALKCWIVFSRV